MTAIGALGGEGRGGEGSAIVAVEGERRGRGEGAVKGQDHCNPKVVLVWSGWHDRNRQPSKAVSKKTDLKRRSTMLTLPVLHLQAFNVISSPPLIQVTVCSVLDFSPS